MTRYGYFPETEPESPRSNGWGATENDTPGYWRAPAMPLDEVVDAAQEGGEPELSEMSEMSEPAAPAPTTAPSDKSHKKAKGRFGRIELTPQRVSESELMHFSRQMASFIRAGIPILDAIDVLAEGTENRTLARALNDIRSALQAGETFHSAASAHPKIFSPLYLGMLRSAELTGRLDSVLDQLSHYLERNLEAKRKIRSALAYPVIILLMSLVTVVVLTAFVLPRFEKFFESLHAELPLPTRILLNSTDFLQTWWFLFAGGTAALIGGVLLGRRTRRGRRLWDGFLLKLPVIGETVRYAVIERFSRILASMVHAGVPLPDAMTVAGEGTNNRVYEDALAGAREHMLRGEGISRPIADTNLFPASAIQMMRVGEDTGSLDAQLESTASFYEQELDYKLKHLTTLFEPLVIVLMGVIVGFVAIALVSAMYGIFSQSGTV